MTPYLKPQIKDTLAILQRKLKVLKVLTSLNKRPNYLSKGEAELENQIKMCETYYLGKLL